MDQGRTKKVDSVLKKIKTYVPLQRMTDGMKLLLESEEYKDAMLTKILRRLPDPARAHWFGLVAEQVLNLQFTKAYQACLLSTSKT